MTGRYDIKSIESILEYAKSLEGKTFREVLKINEHSPDFLEMQKFAAKGKLGNLLEQFFFDLLPNSRQEADFVEANLELKLTCLNERKDGSFTAGERLSITNISYLDSVEEDFYKSHVWAKLENVLLIHYLRDKNLNPLDYKILYVNLFTPPEKDLEVIKRDYLDIISKIKRGEAHKISEGDTLYLGACTKGATAASSWRPQYYGNHIPAKKRNFCLKRSYMDFVLREHILPRYDKNFKAIKTEQITDIEKLKGVSIEDLILNKLKIHLGKSDRALCDELGINFNQNKAQWTSIVYRILGIKSNRAEELLKADISVRVFRVDKNNKPKESISFSPFEFKKNILQEWEESDFYNELSAKKFLFVVFKENDGDFILDKIGFWNMSERDLDFAGREWNKVKKIIQNGVILKRKGNIIENNLPGMRNTEIIHVRPHTARAAYRLSDGYENGDLEKDGDELPDGQIMTKQSFWLNSKYIAKQIEKL